MIIHHTPLTLRVPKDSLSPRRIHIPMTRQNRRAPVLRETILPIAIEIRPRDVTSATHNNAVLIARRHEFVSCATALPDTEEHIILLLILMHNGALNNRIISCRIRYNRLDALFLRPIPCEVLEHGWVVHGDLLDAGPVGAECEVKRFGGIGLLIYERVDEVVAGALGEAESTVVGPGAECEGRGGSDADFAALGTDEGDGVVAVPGAVVAEERGRLLELLVVNVQRE